MLLALTSVDNEITVNFGALFNGFCQHNYALVL